MSDKYGDTRETTWTRSESFDRYVPEVWDICWEPEGKAMELFPRAGSRFDRGLQYIGPRGGAAQDRAAWNEGTAAVLAKTAAGLLGLKAAGAAAAGALADAATGERVREETDVTSAGASEAGRGRAVDAPQAVELGKTETVNPYMTNGATAEALFALFSMVALMICWIECCKALLAEVPGADGSGWQAALPLAPAATAHRGACRGLAFLDAGAGTGVVLRPPRGFAAIGAAAEPQPRELLLQLRRSARRAGFGGIAPPELETPVRPPPGAGAIAAALQLEKHRQAHGYGDADEAGKGAQGPLAAFLSTPMGKIAVVSLVGAGAVGCYRACRAAPQKGDEEPAAAAAPGQETARRRRRRRPRPRR
ncbi:unnamed protein product, partial [Prorocentrum cordatum]